MNASQSEHWYLRKLPALHWVATHQWTVENFWDDWVLLDQSWRTINTVLHHTEINQLVNSSYEAIAPFVQDRQAEFEQSYFSSKAIHRPVADIINGLSFISMFINEASPLAQFSWSATWVNTVLSRDPKNYVRNAMCLLVSRDYTSEQKHLILLSALGFCGDSANELFSLFKNEDLFSYSPNRRAVSLAAALAFEKTDSLTEKMALSEYINPKMKYSLRRPALDYLSEIVPEAIPVWDTIVSLGVSFENAWNLVSNTIPQQPALALPMGFAPIS